jgi:tetratricopeptide (TPR) repeat protein
MEDPTETVPLHGGQPWPGSVPGAESLERGATVGRYVVLDRIGSGGMGVVYAAWDPELERRVALKLLRPERFGNEPDRLRLLREAQALARLTHPNVVAVHDAGTFGDRVFLAMELVEGRTLRQWLAEGGRSWREILALFLAAGRGLAAAHAAGLVHRDFKPGNVLIGRDGRARVVDFGLARALGEPEAADWGFVQGTPAYMAPEQGRGASADARSDQFSFCVSLHEALFGELPFADDGSPRGAFAGTRAPRWLREALRRGLRTPPEERYPSMDVLLRELERDPDARRRRWLASGTIVLVTAGLFSSLGYLHARRSRLCGGGEEALAGIWNPARRRAIHAAFAATRLPFAETVWRSVDLEMDRYTRDWAVGRRRACEATRVRGEQSEDLLDRKMFCLDQRLRDVQALTVVFSRADAKVVERASEAVSGLSDLSSCSQAGALLEKTPPPRDPAVRARVQALQGDLAAAKALQKSGKYREGLARAEAMKGEVLALPFPPLRAELLFLLGRLHVGVGEFRTSEEELYQAAWAAEEARDDLLKVEAWRELVYNVGFRQERYGEVGRLERQAEAALARAGGDPKAEMSLLNTEATVLNMQGDYPRAVEKLERARALSERIDPRRTGYGVLLNMGATYREMGEPERAIPVLRRALEIAERSVGPDHPHVAGARFNLGLCLSDLGRYEEAESLLEGTLAARERLLGPVHPDVADTLVALGGIRIQTGRSASALPLLERALAIYDDKAPGTPHEWAMAHYNLGEADRRLGRYAAALEHERKAVRCIEQAAGPESDYLPLPLETLGATYLDRGRSGEAVAPLERALRIYQRRPTLSRWAADVRFLLARALWAAGGDRNRALALARQAYQDSTRIGGGARGSRVGLPELKAWLAEREPASGKTLG